jgi:N-acyl-D-aspartate/D-glutamate deacylase
VTVLERDHDPASWQRQLDGIGAANAAGHVMTGQIRGRPTSVLLGFELSLNPFQPCPSWQAVADLPFKARIAALRDPALRQRLIGEDIPARNGVPHRLRHWERIFPLGDPPDYEPGPERSIAAIAQARGVTPAEIAYDLLMEKDGKTILYRPMTNYLKGNLDSVRDMMAHPNTLIGLGDGGAHVGIMCDATDMTHTLTHWTRDRAAGGLFPVEWMVKRLTRDNAQAIGLHDRGRVAVGAKADLNVIDYGRLKLRAPEVIYDLPAGGKRLMQRADGYVATIVSGTPIFREGEATGALPGRLVRGPRQMAGA